MDLTQDILHHNVGRLGAGLRVASSVYGVDPEAALLALLQVRDCDLSGGVELVSWVHPPPIRRAIFMDLDDVTLDGAAAIFVWRSPGEGDAALRLVLHFRTAGGAGRIWSKVVSLP